MSMLSYAVADSATMLRRQLRHMLRYLSMTLMLIGMPVVFLLLFVYVFGGTLGAGLGGVAGGRPEYLGSSPGILLMAVAAGAIGTSIAVAMDMTEGIIARFRTMAIFRPSVLTGHVLGAHDQTMLSVVVVTVVAMLIGFRADASPVEWARAGVLGMTTFALTWLCVGCGLAAKNVEAASNLPSRWCSCPSWAAGSSPPTRCRPPCAGSPNTSRSRPSSTPARGAAARHRHRRQRGPRRRLVRRHHPGRLPLVKEALQPRPRPLASGQPLAAPAARPGRRPAAPPRPGRRTTTPRRGTPTGRPARPWPGAGGHGGLEVARNRKRSARAIIRAPNLVAAVAGACPAVEVHHGQGQQEPAGDGPPSGRAAGWGRGWRASATAGRAARR